MNTRSCEGVDPQKRPDLFGQWLLKPRPWLHLLVIGLVVLGYTIAGLYYFGWLFPQFYTFGNALVSTMFIGLGDWSLYGPLTSAILGDRLPPVRKRGRK